MITTTARRQPIICTSSTRPTSPVNGLMIFETDTNELLLYYASPGQWRRPWTMPWGIIGYVQNTAGASFTTVTDITSLTLTFTAVANRRYKVTAFLPRTSCGTANMSIIISITDGSNNVLEQAHQIEGPAHSSGGGATTHVSVVHSPAAGSFTYKVRGHRDGGSDTHTVYSSAAVPAWLLIEDLGPNGAPA